MEIKDIIWKDGNKKTHFLAAAHIGSVCVGGVIEYKGHQKDYLTFSSTIIKMNTQFSFELNEVEKAKKKFVEEFNKTMIETVEFFNGFVK